MTVLHPCPSSLSPSSPSSPPCPLSFWSDVLQWCGVWLRGPDHLVGIHPPPLRRAAFHAPVIATTNQRSNALTAQRCVKYAWAHTGAGPQSPSAPVDPTTAPSAGVLQTAGRTHERKTIRNVPLCVVPKKRVLFGVCVGSVSQCWAHTSWTSCWTHERWSAR